MISLKRYGKAVDWWSLGVLIYEMLTGLAPFRGPDPQCIYQQILDGKVSFERIPEQHTIQGKRAIVLVKQLLVLDPAQRAGSSLRRGEDIKQALWFHGIAWQA